MRIPLLPVVALALNADVHAAALSTAAVHSSAVVALPHRARAIAPQMAGKVTTLTTESWEEELAACKGLAVVKFWAPWCRTCKAIAPKYEQVVFDYLEEEDVQFFQINFKEAGALCLSQPASHPYAHAQTSSDR